MQGVISEQCDLEKSLQLVCGEQIGAGFKAGGRKTTKRLQLEYSRKGCQSELKVGTGHRKRRHFQYFADKIQ